LLTALLGLGALSTAQAQDDAQGWLERLGGAAKNVSYQGTFIYRHGGRIETMRIVHRGGPEGEAERLVALTGTPREIIRDERRVTCILPDDGSVVLDRRQLANPLAGRGPADAARLRRSYRVELEDRSRIAGRLAQEIVIKPHDRLRYGYRLWADQESGLLLRSDLLDERGEPIEQIMFTELRIVDSVPAEALQPQLAGEGITWQRETAPPPAVADGAAVSAWVVDDLPDGFELVLREVRHIADGGAPVEHLLYSDGLASVSIYIEKGAGRSNFDGRSRIGALHAYGRVVEGEQITVVGDVPAATVARIGASLRRQDAATDAADAR